MKSILSYLKRGILFEDFAYSEWPLWNIVGAVLASLVWVLALTSFI